jgi:flagella basal body P-ring formation protein FlgA
LKKSGPLLLKDIAEFKGLPTEVERALAALPVGISPKAGEKVYYTSYGLSEIFRQPLSVIQKNHNVRIMLSLPQKVTVYNSAVAFSEEAVKMQIENYLEAACDECRYEVSQLQLPIVDETVRQAEWQVELHGGVVRGSFSLPIRFDSRENKRLYWVTGQARKFMRVPVTVRRIGAGERVGTQDVEMKEMDVTFGDDSPAELGQLENAKIRRGLAVGEIVWRKHLQRERAVRFGDVTKVVIGAEGWQVSTTAVAQQNGDIGDRIRLLNTKTRNFITAKVVGPKLVKVE